MAKTTGAKLFAEIMQGYGITHVFYVPQVVSKALVAMEDMPIRRVVAHSEKAAGYMADGYARARGGPGVCMAQPIGASNLASGLRDAYMARSPVIAISGGPTPASRYRHSYQEVEDFDQFNGVTKSNVNVDSPSRVPDLMRQAFRTATSGTPGPVHLRFQGRLSEVPLGDTDEEAVIEQQFARVPPFRPEPEAERVREAAAVLAAAKKPIIIAGGGVVWSQAQREVVELAEKLKIPVVTSLNGKGVILDTHPLSVGVAGTYSRECANRVVSEADLVFFIGSPAGGMVTASWALIAPGTAVMQLDIEPTELGRNYPNKVALLGDAKVSLRRLIDAAQAKEGTTKAWVGRVQQLVAEWRAQAAPKLNSDAVPMDPARICKEITNALPANGVVVADTGHAGMWTSQFIDLNQPGQRYIRCAGSLGWGLPGAIGVKCALPNQPVLCFTGDGGMYYHMIELDTALRYGINLVVLVNNNRALSQEFPSLNRNYGGNMRGHSDELWRFGEFNFAKVAEAMGCAGFRVEQPGELKGVLQKAFTMNKPVVVEVMSDVSLMAPVAWVPK
ncbi:MAG: putative acetolactate synthase large subunit [Betaproteobacteria bacterium]|jgi:acetolactate synthase-1/2/3 large subunit|nr:putative acetolactate synthase large subunit [Betaproteobacteria bacterium]